jgi:peptidoglycan hydrolase FlgJ
MQVTSIHPDTTKDATLRIKAAELEGAFLNEMLAYTGMDKPSEEFSGGHGEEQFASFLRREYAGNMVASGGIGLAEQIFQSLSARSPRGS